MAGSSRLRRAWRLLLRRSDIRRAVDEELAFHLDMTTEELVAQGMESGPARRKAEGMFGDTEAYRRACEEIGQRRRRKRRLRDLLNDGWFDLRLVSRSFRRTPVFTAAAVLTIALGIGTVTTMYTVVRGVLLAPLPYSDPDRLVRLTVRTAFWGESTNLSEPEYLALRTGAATLTDVTLVRYQSRLRRREEPHYVRTVQTSWGLFPLLGIAPLLGRGYTAADDEPGAEPVAVLSHAFWTGECGGDPELIGGSILLDDIPFTVIGVMPAGFDFPAPGVALWTPYQLDPANLDYWNNHYLSVYARLGPGTTPAAARAEVGAMGERFVRDHPEIYEEWDFGLGARLLMEDITGRARAPLLLLLAAVGFFLLIACINVANLLVARGEMRGRELAVRTALGASRRRISSLLLIESGVLAVSGGILGLLLTVLGVGGVVRTAAGIVPRIQEVTIDPGIFLFALIVTGVTGLLFGLLPVLQAGRLDVQSQLREMSRSLAGWRYGARLRRLLVVVEVTLSVVLVTGAIMMVRSLNRLQEFDLGFETDDRLTLRVVLPPFPTREEAAVQNFFTALLDRMKALPGVEDAAAIEALPLAAGAGGWSIRVDGTPSATIGEAPVSRFLQVTPDFFTTMGIDLVAGRSFTRQDRAGTRPVVIVNETFVRRHWPAGEALGRRVALFDSERPWLEVIGVVEDIRQGEILEDLYPTMYIPHAQAHESSYGPQWSMTLVLHGRGVDGLTGPVRALVRETEPAAVIADVRTMDEVRRAALADRVLPTSLLSLFSSLALLLAAVGVYGLAAFLTAARRTEFGLHLALGALPADVRRLVLTQGLRPVVIGVGCGLLAAGLTGGLLQRLLFGVARIDLPSFAIVTVLLILTALAAGLVPAVRAGRIDPMQVLKTE